MPKTILLIRHAIAQNRDDAKRSGIVDEKRGLTLAGKKRWQNAVFGLRYIQEDIEYILTSPYRRARETARILQKCYPKSRVIATPLLKPDTNPAAVLEFLSSITVNCVAMVGHEPELGHILSYSLVGTKRRLAVLKKGSIACLRIKTRSEANTARIQWILTSSQLAAIASNKRDV